MQLIQQVIKPRYGGEPILNGNLVDGTAIHAHSHLSLLLWHKQGRGSTRAKRPPNLPLSPRTQVLGGLSLTRRLKESHTRGNWIGIGRFKASLFHFTRQNGISPISLRKGRFKRAIFDRSLSFHILIFGIKFRFICHCTDGFSLIKIRTKGF